MDNFGLIKTSLQELLNQPRHDHPWVIVEHDSGKFIQFAGSTAEMLLLDLPWQSLSESEFYRAVAFFKRLGIAGDENETIDVEGNPGGQFTFNMSFRSVNEATEVVLSIFEQVYGLQRGCELSVATSWTDCR